MFKVLLLLLLLVASPQVASAETRLGRATAPFAYLPGYPTPHEALASMTYDPSHIPVWSTWTMGTEMPDIALIDKIRARGIVPVIFWQPDRWAGLHRNVLSGQFDAYLDRFAKAIGNRRVIIRFAHEHTGTWFAWSAYGKEGNSPYSFKRMWRYVHDRVERFAPNVKWYWCPWKYSGRPYTETYPGPAYVDYVGFDAYGWTSTSAQASTIFKSSMAQVKQFGKPIIIGETGIAHDYPYRLDWVKRMVRYLDNQGVHAVLYFDIDMRFEGHPDWRLRGVSTYWKNQSILRNE